MSRGYYILEGHEPKEIKDITKWGEAFEGDRILARTTIGNVLVSTVFLGLDHSYDEGVPILFETMIFGGKHDQYQERYATWDDAEIGHKKAIQLVENKNTGDEQ